MNFRAKNKVKNVALIDLKYLNFRAKNNVQKVDG